MSSHQKGEFWQEWIQRFEDNQSKFIDPNHRNVIKFTREAVSCTSCSDKEKAEKIWGKINKGVEYELSYEWKTPDETISVGVGDCEDVTFLFASSAIRAGIENVEVVIGNLNHRGGKEKHTWNRVEGMTVDPTGPPGVTDLSDYQEVMSWTIKWRMR